MAGEEYSKNGIKVIRELHVSKNLSTIKNTRWKQEKKLCGEKYKLTLKQTKLWK